MKILKSPILLLFMPGGSICRCGTDRGFGTPSAGSSEALVVLGADSEASLYPGRGN